MNTMLDLGKEELKKVHEYSIDIIENRGIRFHSRKVLEILDGAGAEIDGDTARIPGDVIEDALGKAPASFLLGAQKPDNRIDLAEDRTNLSLDGCAAHVIDFASGKKRASSKEDIQNMALIGDYMDEIDIISPMVSAQDCYPGESRPLHELGGCLTHTDKHVVTESTASAGAARAQIELAAAVAGGKEELRKNPVFSNFVCTISPLTQDGGGIEAALEFAEAGVPVGFYSMATTGVTSPVSQAGTLVMLNAEVISALTAIQLAVPGAKVFYSGGPATMNIRSGAYVASSPEALRLRMAVAEMADHYEIPCHVGAGATSAKVPGSQSAGENVLSILLPSLAGANVLFGMGLLDGSNLLRYEKVLIDCEFISVIQRIFKGMSFKEELLGLDLMKDLGPGGVYLDQKHTVDHMRSELSTSELFDRDSFDKWVNEGKLTVRDKAREKVKSILENHRVEPLPDSVQQEMESIINDYTEKLEEEGVK